MALPGELPPLVELSDQTLWIRENTLALDRRVCGAPTCPLGGGFCFRCHPQQLGKVPSPSSSQAQPPFEMEHQFSSSLLVKIHPSPYWGRLGTQPPGDRATERTIGSRKDTPPSRRQWLVLQEEPGLAHLGPRSSRRSQAPRGSCKC